MARFNELQVGRYNRLVQKLLSMKGTASLVTLSDEMLTALSLFHGVENRYLEAWDRFGVGQLQAGAVGLNSAFRFRNPSGSSVVAVIERLSFSDGTADSFVLSQGAIGTDLAGVATGTRLDPRGRSNATLIVSQTNGAGALAGQIGRVNNIASVDYNFITDENQEIPILPGDALHVQSLNLNVALVCSAIWRERFLEDSERA